MRFFNVILNILDPWNFYQAWTIDHYCDPRRAAGGGNGRGLKLTWSAYNNTGARHTMFLSQNANQVNQWRRFRSICGRDYWRKSGKWHTTTLSNQGLDIQIDVFKIFTPPPFSCIMESDVYCISFIFIYTSCSLPFSQGLKVDHPQWASAITKKWGIQWPVH